MSKMAKRLVPFLFGSLLVGLAPDLRGQSGIYDRVGVIPGHGTFGSLPEEHIDLFTGNVTLRYRDIYLPGPNGLDVEVWRVYNSKILMDRQSGNPTVQAYPHSWIGMGWTMHMGMVHNIDTNMPVIEFPDGRRETAYLNNYNLGNSVYLTRDFSLYSNGSWPASLRFKNGVRWEFEARAAIEKGDGSYEIVLLVTKICSPYGHTIQIVYDPDPHYPGRVLPSIQTITDATGRVITFETDSSLPKKLQRIQVKDAGGNDRIFNYIVGNYGNGYYRLDNFTAPMLPATTFEYLDGSLSRYELSRMTTSYGGVLEYAYTNKTLYFNGIPLDSRVVSQKNITFNPGGQATWSFTYPSYQGVATGTVQVQGPVFNTSVTYNAYTTSAPWKIGLMSAKQAGDGSYSDSYSWTCQQISTTNWTVLGTNMGAAKGPLVSSVIEGRIGDASSKVEYLYEGTEPKRYGLPTKLNRYVGSSGPLKNTTNLVYFFEGSNNFKTRHMMEYLSHEDVCLGSTSVKKTDTTYFEETGKYGALKQVKRWKSGQTYLIWDYEYSSTNPNSVQIKVDPPGYSDKEIISFTNGVEDELSLPDYSALTRSINYYDSSIYYERRQEEGRRYYDYDNLGRITDIRFRSSDPENPNEIINRIHYNWTSDVNSVTITQGGNIVTKFWDGMGRDLGATETGGGIAVTLYSLRTLDAEGRVRTESHGSISDDHIYTYAYNAAGQVTSVTDPRGKTTTISCQGTTKTVTDPEGHATTYVYGDLPGLPTQVTDAMGKTAVYSYDAAGRLLQVIFNGTRSHNYTYDGLDNVLTEIHPETGTITYAYNNENLLSSRTWGGSTLGFSYDISKRLIRTTATTGGPIDTVDYAYNTFTGRVESIIDITTGWRRENIDYNLFGLLTSEKITIPGLAPKTLSYGYDLNLNPSGWKESSNLSTGVTISNNALNMPESVSFNQAPVVSGASYGPNKLPASITFCNTTAFSATYNNAGMPTYFALARGGTTLYDASYDYDGAGNIHSITSTAPALTATFGYDALNRLTSAAYSSGSPATYSYEYDEYGNMRKVWNGTSCVFDKYYTSQNRIQGFSYDSRGNLLASDNGKFYYWDAQNRLQYIQNTSGAVIGKYLYDDRGLRLMAVPPLPEINVRHEAVDIPDEGEAFLRGPIGQTSIETLTIYNLGDANLNISSVDIPNDPENNFDFSTPTSPILPNGSANFEIQFHPQTTGPKTATLTVTCNDPDEGTCEIILFGNYEPEISIPQAPDGGTFDYGEITIGDFWQQTFTIHNSGDKDLVLYGNPIVVIDGEDADQFEVISQPNTIYDPLPLHIGHNLSRTFVIRFSPNSEGLKTASISIANNDWDENPYDITLEGTGVLGTDKIDDDTAFVVTSPAEGEELVPGSTHLITWTGAPEVKEVRIDFSIDNGSTYKTIVERTENIGSYPWLVPPVISGLCLVRVSSADGTSAEAEALSVEFKVKMTSGGAGTSGLTLRTSLPEPKISGSWSAEIAFTPDEVRKTMALSLNSAGTDSGPSASFYGKWHTVRLALDHASGSGSLWLDGQPILHMVPLVQGAWLGESPFVELRTAGGSDVRVEDFEARFKDRALKPEIEGQEVSQLLVKDSFENYPEGLFPSTGGWRLNADTQGLSGQVFPEPQVSPARPSMDPRRDGQGRRSADSTGKIREESSKGTQERTGREEVPERRQTYVDGADSVTGLRSLVFSGDEPVEIILVKPLELPTTAPFGVSDGNFAVGEAPENTGERLSRSRVLDRLRRDDEKGRTRREEESALGNGTRQPEEAANSSWTVTSGSASSASGKSEKLMSAAPVGNYYIYSFDGRLLQVYDIYGALLKDFIYMGNRLVAEYDHVNTRLLYYTPDQINSTRVVTDGGGNVVYTATYDPYGNIRTETGSIDPLLKFSGKERDAESQLDYFGARYYDRSQYRFISADPRVAPSDSSAGQQHCNLYPYCLNNPILGMDPDGRDTIISVFRTDSSSASTTGIMFVCDKSLFPTKVIGETWELPYKNNAENISCIEAGVYAAHLRFRENLGYDVIELENRHGRTGVQIHPKGRKNEGCITLKKPSDFWKLMRTVGLVPSYGPNGEMDVSPYEPIVVCVFWWDFPKIPEPIPVVSYEYKVTGYK